MIELSQRLTDRSKPLHIHLIGVAGSGMSGLALLLLGMGHKVSGSDQRDHGGNRADAGRGPGFLLAAHRGSREEARTSSSIPPPSSRTIPAYAAAVAAKIPLYRRAECLAAILHTRKGIIISGTHGKTTTSSMTAHVLREAGHKPSHYVGAEIPILGANAKWSEDGEFMVAEGDESDGTLALYRPEHSVILNIEAEHLDFYRDLDHIREVFTTLADQTSGKLVYCAEDPVALELCAGRENAVSYGWEDADYTATDLRDLKGSSAFTVKKNGEVARRHRARHPRKPQHPQRARRHRAGGQLRRGVPARRPRARHLRRGQAPLRNQISIRELSDRRRLRPPSVRARRHAADRALAQAEAARRALPTAPLHPHPGAGR